MASNDMIKMRNNTFTCLKTQKQPVSIVSGGVLLKALSVAAFAGCVAISQNPALAEDYPAPQSTLEKLHNSGALVPGTEDIYPEGAYRLTEVTSAEADEPNVIEYYNPNELDNEVHYYRVDLKYSEYGEGGSQKYYKWDRDEIGIKLVEASDASEAVLTLNYNPDDVAEKVYTNSGDTLTTVDNIYIVKDIKKAIVSAGLIENVSAQFQGSTIDVIEGDTYDYSAVVVEHGAQISNINSTFVGNKITSNDTKTIYGTLVKSIGSIDKMYSEFVGNTLFSHSGIMGGFVEVSGTGRINDISSDFIANRTLSEIDLWGNLIANDGHIGQIHDSKFIDNYGVSAQDAYGGVLYNNNTIEGIKDSSFIGNYIVSMGNAAYGGAIANQLNISDIQNTIFRDNYAESTIGKAYGGAIYTYTDLKISANDGKTTEFTNNYVIKNGVKENQAIYAGTKDVILTLSATGNGKILLNDEISGVSGYDVILTGDNTGRIYLYDNINRADVTAENVNIDTADGKLFGYNFSSLTSSDSANYKIDIDFANKTSDTFTLGKGSQGTILISDLNLLGELPATDAVIQVLTAPDTISIALSQDVIDKYTTVTRGDSTTTLEDIAETTLWDAQYNKHIYTDTVTRSLTTTASEGRELNDSIKYYTHIDTEETVETMGDTFVLMNAQKEGDRTFKANSAQDTYTLSEDLGLTAGGVFTVQGLKSGSQKSTIDTNGHTMFEVNNANAKVVLSNLNITDNTAQDGAILNITAGSATLRDSIDITGNPETNGIINNGTLNFTDASANIHTNISGDGQLNLHGNVYLKDNASILQKNIHILAYGHLYLDNESTLTGEVRIEDWGILHAVADNLKSNINNLSFNGAWGALGVHLKGGTLNVDIFGTNGTTYIYKDVLLNSDVYNRIRIANNAVLTTAAEHIKGSVETYQGNGTLNLTGGELSKSVNAYAINITEDTTFKTGSSVTTGTNTYVEDGKYLTIENASVIKGGRISLNGEDSVVELQGGTLTGGYKGDICGLGKAVISGDVSMTAWIFTYLEIKEGASLTASGDYLRESEDILNNGTLYLNGGIFQNRDVFGDGKIVTTGTVTYNNRKMTQDLFVKNGVLYIAAGNLQHSAVTNGGLIVRGDGGGGTLSYDVSGTGYLGVDSGIVRNIAHITTPRIYRSATLISNADLLGGYVDGTGILELTGGTMNYRITGGILRTVEGGDVIAKQEVSSTRIEINKDTSLTIDAKNVKGDAYVSGDLYLGDGTLDRTLYHGGTTHITGDVKTTNKRIDTKVSVEESGILTVDGALFNNSSITNHGLLNLSNILNKTVAGEDGTTRIINNLTVAKGALIQGILDLNNGNLSTDNSLSEFSLGTAINSGALSFALSDSKNTSDSFILNPESTGEFNISIDRINIADVGENSEKIFQILKGGEELKAKLVLEDGKAEKDINVKTTTPVELDKADVYYDDEFNNIENVGTLHYTIELATTESENDSIKLTSGAIEWAGETAVREDLLRALNQYETEETRHFRFREADNEYIVLDNLGQTAAGEINIHGVYDEETGQRSVVDMNGHSGFRMVGGSTLNIYDTEFKNAFDSRMLLLDNGSNIGSISVDDEGNETISGGIVNSAFTDNTMTVDTKDIVYFGTAFFHRDSVISQIKDSVFKGNTGTITNSDIYFSPWAIGGAVVLDKTAQIGSKLTGEGGIINTTFENNGLIGGAGTSTGHGGAIDMRDDSFISQIKDSTFKGNYVKGFNGAIYGGAINMSNNSQIGTKDDYLGGITNTTFEGNYLDGSSNGGSHVYGTAIVVSNNSYISNIIDSTFRGNYAKNRNIMAGALSVYNTSKIHNIYNTMFEDNYLVGSNPQGAAIFMDDSARIDKIEKSTFQNNYVSSGTGLGGAIYLSRTGTILEIINTEFKNNESSQIGGAIYLRASAKIGKIEDSVFEGNKARTHGGAIRVENNAIISEITGTKFINNKLEATNSDLWGGAIASTDSGGKINTIKNCEFISNTVTGNSSSYGGAISSGMYIDLISDSLFKNNMLKGNGNASGGAIRNNNGTINTITDSVFEGNEIYAVNGVAWGSAIYNNNSRVITTLKNSTFKNNYTESKNSWSTGSIYVGVGAVITNAENLTFVGNHAYGGTNVFGGGFAANGRVANGIINSTFKDNYIVAKTAGGQRMGGGLYTWANSLKVIAKDNFTSEFVGNYTMVEGNESSKDYNGIYINGGGLTLTLDANTGGRFLFEDNIRGIKGYKTLLTGDSTGKISLYNNIYDSNITAEKVNIDTANGKFYDYNFLSLASRDTARYGIDIDFLNEKADTFKLVNNSSGKIYIDNLNIINAAEKITKVQVLKSPNANIQLALDPEKFHIVDDVILTCKDLVYDTDIFHQQAGLNVSTTDTFHDSITMFTETDFDTLSIIGSSELNKDRTFSFRSNNEYNVFEDLRTVAQGSFSVKGLEGDHTTSTINANSHSMFELANDTDLLIENTKIYNAKNNDVINVINKDATITLKNANIDGNIKGSEKYTIDVNGSGKSTISGLVENAQTTVTSGSLAFGTQTFAAASDTLTLNGGGLALDNNSVEVYNINKLDSANNSSLTLDIDLAAKQADKIVIADTSSKGVINVSYVNFFNNIADEGNFETQVLDTNGNSNISLAIDENVNSYVIRNLSREENDEINSVTKNTDIYNVYTRKGILGGNLYLATTQTENDSLGFEVKEKWETSREYTRKLGDTLSLVNQADLEDRTFKFEQATDVYFLSDELGKTHSGTFYIDGVTSDSGDEKSTVNLRDYNGFNIGEDTVLYINNAAITGTSGDGSKSDIITAEDSSAELHLNNAYIDGNIIGNEKFNINITGVSTTTITGAVINADTVLKRGDLTIGVDTFADTNSTLTVESGSINMDNGEIEDYKFGKLVSGDKSKFSIDIDLENEISDTITVGAGSSGVIVLNELNITGGLSQVGIDDEYTIEILKNTQGADIELQLSESVLSQINQDILLGTDHVIVDTDEVNPNTLWSQKYYVDEQDLGIYGRLNLADINGAKNNALHLYHLSIVEGEVQRVLGDTLRLLNQLETTEDRTFTFETASDRYDLTDYIGTTTAGKFSILGVADNDDKTVTSVIDMNKKAGFGLSNESTLNISNVKFENTNFKDGSVINVSNENAVVNLDNVYIIDANCANAIANAGTLNMTGGNVVLNSGIIGQGITNIAGADVVLGDSVSITQQQVNINNGSLTLADNGVIRGALSIAEDGTATLHTKGLTSAVSNDGNITFTGGVLAQNISGKGTTNITGNVVNSAKINNNVNVKSGTLTSSVEQISGSINNDAELILNGKLDKNVTGDGTTKVNQSLTLSQGAGFDGTLALNSGKISSKDSQITDYNIGTMTGEGSFTIDVDFKSGTSDKFIVGNSSSGKVYIDSINYLNIENINETLKVQVLETNGNSDIQLALNKEISEIDYKVGRTSRDEHDTILAQTNYKDIYKNYLRGGDVYGNLVAGTTKTENDSIVVKVDDSKTVWDENREFTTVMGDTLALWNNLDSTENKVFNIDKVDTYKVADSAVGLGETKGQNLSVNGVSSDETTKSTINLNGKTGFELNSAQSLNINNVKLTGSEDLITVTNSDAVVNLNNTFVDGNITGDKTYNVGISGSDTTTLNGKLTNSVTTLTSGGLKFNTDTFEASNDSLTVQGGSVILSNGSIEDYIINNLESDANAKYSIDVNLSEKSSDTIHVSSGFGVITLDNLNIQGSAEDLNKDYKIQILYTPSDSLELSLSDNAQSQLGEEIVIGKTEYITDDEVKVVTNWKDIYNRYSREDLTYGKLTLAQTQTKNDSIGINVTKVVQGETELVGPIGDTLRLVNNAQNHSSKIFEFDTSSDKYKVSENLGSTYNNVNVKGISDESGLSTIDFDAHSGFELTQGSSVEISNTELRNAQAQQGSVVYTDKTDANTKLTNVIIANNVSTGEHGAAIYSNSDVEINADNGTSMVLGNATSDNNEAVYLGENAKLTLNSVNNGKLIFNDRINGQSSYLVKITGDKSGNIYLNDRIDNAHAEIDTTTVHLASDNNFESSNVNVNSGRIDLVNGLAQQQKASQFNVLGSFVLDVDVDLAKEVMDRLPVNTTIQSDAFINVDKMNLLSDTKAESVAIPFAYNQFKDNVKYIGEEVLSKETQITAFAPIYKYSVKYENRDDLGYFVFGRGGGASPNTPDAYNPAVLASPVASQAGAYSAMNQSWNYVFEHIDSYMSLPKSQRLAVKNVNKSAINTSETPLFGMSEYNRNAIWNQSYATFESIGLKNGPKVNTTSYGTIVGGDGELKTLANGWLTVTTAYAGYNGSNQHYSGVSTYQNGGLLGATQTFYKDNFFTALTASAGASVGEANTMYGHEDFTSFMAGIASKTGYNIEFKDGKYILQPGLLAAYTFINTFDYTNAAGVRINSDPLHTIQIHPEMKFIANLQNGWQPYARVGMVWNILNDTKVSANDVMLPQMSIKPYVEYGVGVQKRWKDNFSGYLQAMLRNGGRNGVSLTAGFRWALGNEGKPIEKVHGVNNKVTSAHSHGHSEASAEESPQPRKVLKQMNANEKSVLTKHTTRTTKTAVRKQL